MPDEFVKAAKITDLPEDDDMIAVEIESETILVANVGGTFYAIDNECSHAGGPLADGSLDGGEVQCPWHSSFFDVKTGLVTGAPADEPVSSYAVRLEGEDILVGPSASQQN